MIRLIFFLAVATLLALVAVWFVENPGTVQLEWLGYRLQTGVGMLVVAVLIVAFVITALFELLRILRGAPGRWSRHRRARRERRGYRELSRGLIAAAAGDGRAARLHAREAGRLLPAEPAVFLLSAQSAQIEGNEAEAYQSYRAMLRQPETEFLAVRGLLAQAIKLDDRSEALELARRAYRLNPEAPWTAQALFDLETKHAHWRPALELVPALERSGQVSPSDARRHRAALLVLIARDELEQGRAETGLTAARQAHRLVPTFTPAAVTGAACAKAAGNPRTARRLLEQAWYVRPHPDLAKAYAELVPDESAPERLRRFERLRRRHPEHVETHLTLAELALAAGDQQTAERHLQTIVARGPTKRTCRLMAELEKARGAPAEVIETWQARATNAQPDPAWVCEKSGNVLPEWEPFDPTGRFGGVIWTIPPTVARLLTDQRPPTFVLGGTPGEPPSAPARSAPPPAPQAQPPIASA